MDAAAPAWRTTQKKKPEGYSLAVSKHSDSEDKFPWHFWFWALNRTCVEMPQLDLFFAFFRCNLELEPPWIIWHLNVLRCGPAASSPSRLTAPQASKGMMFLLIHSSHWFVRGIHKKVAILLPQKRVGESKIGATTLLMSMSWIPICQELLLDQKRRIQTWVARSTLLFGKPTHLTGHHPFPIGNTSTFMVEFPLDSCMVFDICLFKNLRFACRLFQAGELHLQEVHLRGRGTGQQASHQWVVCFYTWIGAL